ncbi:MAG: adenylate/guanylate cyclase domain-containing protein [Syntrophaceae bacterium]|nr:adenylate/guanylate cyclase domain-containing protein [Syntrophaceae bacterium]
MTEKFHNAGFRKILQGLIAAVAGFVMTLVLWMPGWLDTWELRSWDWRVNLLEALRKPPGQDNKIRLILLDQNSLDWAKQTNDLSWPWPREAYATILNFLKRSGARAVGFDVLFTEPSRYGVEDDQSFGAAIGDYGKFSAAVFLGDKTGEFENWPPQAHRNLFKVTDTGESPARKKTLTYSRAAFPISEISRNAFALTNVHMNPDPDSVYRRVPLYNYFDGQWVPSLGLGVYLSAHPETAVEIKKSAVLVGTKQIPIDQNGQAILQFKKVMLPHHAYSAASIIQSELSLMEGGKPSVNTEAFQDCYVFFGFSAPGLLDLRAIPLAGVYPGVMVHLAILENLLTNTFVRQINLPIFLAISLILVLIAGIASSLVSGMVKTAFVYLISILLPVATCALFYLKGYWLPLVVPETAVILTLVSAGLVYYNTEGRQKRFIKNAFQQYLSPAVIEELIANPDRLKLGGERRKLSIFFSDLEGFTSISEKLSPEELTSVLNEYLSAMTEIIHEEGGTVDKYEGDAIIAFWNAPLLQEDHARRCVRAALRCQGKLAEMTPHFQEKIGRDLKMRIGVNTGVAVVGNMGSQTRFDYTMMGDAVNLASRLEGINKEFGTYTMISSFTLDELGNAFPVRELSRVRVVGKKEAVTVYEPMLEDDYVLRKDMLIQFSWGLQYFYAGDFEEAMTCFMPISDQDNAARSYIEKCRELISEKPEHWDGTWVMTKK